jgi:hypothetical protein
LECQAQGGEAGTIDRAAIEAEADRIFSDAPDPNVEWQRELRRSADEALKRWGIDPSTRHEHGMSRRQVARQLFQAEAALKSDPLNALPIVVGDYTSSLDPAGKEAAARAILARMGYSAPDGLDQAARQRLEAYDRQAAAQEQAIRQAIPQARQTLADFSSRHPDFERHRPVMLALMQAGAARNLDAAYEMAVRTTLEGGEAWMKARHEEAAKPLLSSAGQRWHGRGLQARRTPRALLAARIRTPASACVRRWKANTTGFLARSEQMPIQVIAPIRETRLQEQLALMQVLGEGVRGYQQAQDRQQRAEALGKADRGDFRDWRAVASLRA